MVSFARRAGRRSLFLLHFYRAAEVCHRSCRSAMGRAARREFETARKRTPGRSLLLLDLARACRAMGDSAAAASAYRQVAANWKRANSTIAAAREARAAAK